MAELSTLPDEAQLDSTDDVARSASPVKKLVLLVALVVAVVAAECVLALFIIPSPDEVAADLSRQLAIQKSAVIEENDEEEIAPVDEEGPMAEVDLGDYSVTVHQPSANITLRVDFQVIGMVLEKDKSELLELLEKHRHRLRDNIIVEIRARTESDLNDPGLGLIKRRVLATSNDLFGKSILKGVVFSRFAFYEH